MIVFEDLGNKSGKHDIKHSWLDGNGFKVQRVPLPVGDYIIENEKVLDVISRKTKRGIALKKMDFLGTYQVAVDTKENMQEIVGNICGKSHDRFRDECILAQNNGIKLYILVENQDEIRTIEDVKGWHNPRLDIYTRDWSNPIGYGQNGYIRYGKKLKYPTATKGITLYKAMHTMDKKYGCKFEFCTPQESGLALTMLLNGGCV